MSDPVTIAYQGRVAVITLDRASKLNALTKDGFYLLSKCLREVDQKDEVVITVITGKGRFFSAGADVSVSRATPPNTDVWRHTLKESTSINLNLVQAFYSHTKVLVTALNGPVIGIAAALTAFSDFVYCVPHTYLLTPFSSLGLIAEGGSSLAFTRKMGSARANEALIAGKKLTSDVLVDCGFVNKIFQCTEQEQERFIDLVLKHIDDTMGLQLNGSSMTMSKELLMAPLRQDIDRHLVAELFGGLQRQSQGIPQAEFEKLRTGAKKHKL